ncbi:hypothetical protein B0H63DRAFT_315809 [Podospora didyma]|uniref:Uncharacterized protein n=1 Tax=Podospora didyma TaxID=330526 RepID=A0AAE0K690_9PEZI|nr:hypothetical protein B0H63DRAFT_315809 [Podospora didyma]
MDAGGLAQMSHAPFNQAHGMTMSSGLASRRGGQSIKPLSFDTTKSPTENDNGAPTPRTSRSHLLAGLRTAPKSASAASFPNGPASPTVGIHGQNRNSMASNMYDNVYNGPKTSMPRFGNGHHQQQRLQQHQQQQAQVQLQQQMGYNNGMGYVQQQQLQQQQSQQQQQYQQQQQSQQQQYGQQYTAEQILAPPQIQLDETTQEQIDPNFHAQLVYTNAYLSEQQQRLQLQLKALQAAAQQFQGLSINNQAQVLQQAYPNMYQQQVQNLQAMATPVTPQNVYSFYDPATGQQTLYVDQSQAMNTQYFNQQAQLSNAYANVQQPSVGTPRVQVSPPPVENNKASFRNPSPPRRFDSPVENPTPLPPPSANAFRRGHKKSSSTANGNKGQLSIATEDALRSVGPKTASFPLTPMTAGYGPGQARAGEHPVRQPRNPPSMDELKAKPTAKHDGSKNFVTRTRRSAINNLVRAGLERRKEVRSSGSISPISETTEEMVETPMTDNDSDSDRSGSGSLVDNDDAECSLPSSRTSTGSWGAIGSDRPSSRQKVNRSSVDSTASSDNESFRDPGSFASLLKKGSNKGIKAEAVDGQRKAPMLVLTSAEKRKLTLA